MQGERIKIKVTAQKVWAKLFNWYFFDNSAHSAKLLAYKELSQRPQLLEQELFKLYENKYGG